MSLRIGIDLDGTLADLSAIYREYEETLFGDEPGEHTGIEKRRDEIWRALTHTPDLWTLLKPIEPDAVRELYAAAEELDWEVFFITQRPRTEGANVQRQTQRWLIEHGFATPSVLTLTGSRGKAAHVLDLDFLVDDLAKNCVDVISDSRCRPILILREPNHVAELTAKRMQIGVVRSVREAIALLKQPASLPKASMVTSILQKLGLAR